MLGGMKGFATIYEWLRGIPVSCVQGHFKLVGTLLVIQLPCPEITGCYSFAGLKLLNYRIFALHWSETNPLEASPVNSSYLQWYSPAVISTEMQDASTAPAVSGNN